MASARPEIALKLRCLIDTNICIYILGDAGSRAAARLSGFVPGEVGASIITFAEVLRGVGPHAVAERAAAERFFTLVKVLPFDEAAALAYMRLPFQRGSFDRLIAAHAIALGLPLVTNNERDFADMPGLVLENWMKP